MDKIPNFVHKIIPFGEPTTVYQTVRNNYYDELVQNLQSALDKKLDIFEFDTVRIEETDVFIPARELECKHIPEPKREAISKFILDIRLKNYRCEYGQKFDKTDPKITYFCLTIFVHLKETQ